MIKIYSDGVLGISVDGTMVHVNFANKKLDQAGDLNKDNVEDLLESCATVSMPFLGFAQMMGIVQNLSQDEKFVDIAKRLQEANFLPQGTEKPEDKVTDSKKSTKAS